METYDVHQHLWPEPLVSALSRRGERPRLRRGRLETVEGDFDAGLGNHDPDSRIALLDRDGIDIALLSLAPTLGIEALPPEEAAPLLSAYHDGIRDVTAASGGRFAALAAGAALDGTAGASLPAAALVSDPGSIAGLLRELERRGHFLFVHPGPARPNAAMPFWWAAVVDYTAQMQAAYAAWLVRGPEYPKLRVVFALLAGGAPFQLERLRSRGVDLPLGLDRNVFLDTASYGRRALELCLATYGVRQLVYGSDIPVIESGQTLHAVREFGEAVAKAICGENQGLLLG